MQLARKFGVRGVILSLVVFAPWLMAAQCWSKIGQIPFKFTVERSIDLDEINIDQYTKDVKTGPDGKVPKGAPEVKLPIDVKENLDISDDANIKKYGTKITKIEINKMEVQVVSNSVNIDIPKVELKMGTVKATPSDLIGYLTGIPAKTTPTENIIKTDAARTTISNYMTKYAFSFGAMTTLVVKEGMSKPAGKLKMKVNLAITFHTTVEQLAK
jgi:hypothetical protein